MNESIFTNEQKEKLKQNLTQMREALESIEKGIDAPDIINQFRSGDITVALTKAFETIIELQTDSILHITQILKSKFNLDIKVLPEFFH